MKETDEEVDTAELKSEICLECENSYPLGTMEWRIAVHISPIDGHETFKVICGNCAKALLIEDSH